MRSLLLLPLLLLSCAPASTTPSVPAHDGPTTPASAAGTAAGEASAPATPACQSAQGLQARAPDLLAQGKLHRALRVLDKAASLCPVVEPRGLPSLLRITAEMGLHERARELLPRVASSDAPGGKEAVSFASALLEKGPQDDPDAFRKVWVEAEEEAKNGRWTAAKQKYLEAWRYRHPAPGALLKAAQSARELKEDAEARRLGDRALVELERIAGKPVVAEVSNGFNKVTSVVISPDDRLMAVVDGAKVGLVDLATKRRLPHSFEGHTEEISVVVFSPDGKTLASGSKDRTTRLWDVASGELIATLEGRLIGIDGLDFSSDGKTLAAGAYRTLQLWDVASGKILQSFEFKPSKEETIRNVAFSADEKTLLVGTDDGALKLWDIAKKTPARTVLGSLGRIYSTAVSPDAKIVATGSETSVRLWDVESGKLLHTLRGPSFQNTNMAFSPDGRTFALGAHREVKTLDLATGNSDILEFEKMNSSIKSVALLKNRKTLISSWENGTVLESSLTSKALLHTHREHSTKSKKIAFSPDGKLLASGAEDGTVRVWNMAGKAPLSTVQMHTKELNDIAFSPDGKTLASGAKESGVKLWDMTAGKPQEGISENFPWISRVVYSPGGKLIALAGISQMGVWNTLSKEPNFLQLSHRAYFHALAFSPDESTLASGSDDRSVELWDARSGKLLRTLQGHSADVDHVAYSPDGQVLASGGRDGRVILWQARDGHRLHLLNVDLSSVEHINSFAFSPDGKTIAVGSFNKNIRRWDVASGKPLDDLKGHASHVEHVVYSPDGKTIASCSLDGTARLWDAATGKPLHTLLGHTGNVGQVAFSPDGRVLVSADERVLRLWNTETGSLLATLSAWSKSPRGHVLAAGYIEFGGEPLQEERDMATCRVGNQTYPFWLCEERVVVPGLLSRVIAGDASLGDP